MADELCKSYDSLSQILDSSNQIASYKKSLIQQNIIKM